MVNTQFSIKDLKVFFSLLNLKEVRLCKAVVTAQGNIQMDI
jgi:hypothetical protein